MKREPKVLKEKALESLMLGIEHFNRPSDLGRHEAVLILIDRAFELLLKAVIIHKGGRIRERYAKQTIGFDKCVRKCVSDKALRCLSEEQALTIQIVNSLRDAAQHYILSLSEQQLYTYTQAGVTLFGDIMHRVFGERLRDHLPERVLPVSSDPPKDLHAVIETEFREVKKLVQPYSRRRLEAIAKLRSLAIVESSLQGERTQPGELELNRLIRSIKDGRGWKSLFPGVAKLNLTTEGTGLNITVRLTKREGEPVHLVPEGTPGATVVAVKRVDELGFYRFGLNDLAAQLGISGPRTLALIKHCDLQKSPEFFKEIRIGKTSFKRYSGKALSRLRRDVAVVDMEKVWQKHKPTSRKKKAV